MMDTREAKALQIAAYSRLIFDKGVWLVPSQSGAGVYRVSLSPGNTTCNCEDFSLRAEPCKHIMAARIVQARDHGGKAPVIDTDVLPKRKTYKQDWPAYDEAQTTEKRRFQILLHDLCRGIEEPPIPKMGRRPHSLRDMVFASVFKVYSTFSSRRFSCDLQDAHTRGYLSRFVPGRMVSFFLENEALTPILKALIVRSALPLRVVETAFAPDSSGFSVSRHVRWFDEKYGAYKSGRDWVKAHAIFGVKTNIATAVEIAGRDAADCPMFKPLVETTAENFKVEKVDADKAYLSNDNLELVAGIGGTAFVPFKVNSTAGEPGSIWEKMYHFYQYRREEFLQHYHQRSNAESGFSMIKAKFRDEVRSKTDTAMKNEVYCKFLAHNICCVIMEQCVLGIEAEFWPKDQQAEDGMILKLQRGS
jgi:transposase